MCEDVGDALLQGAVAGVVGGREPIVFAAVPEQLDFVEFGAVGWQKAHVQFFLHPRGPPFLHEAGAVDAGVVEHEHRGAALLVGRERVQSGGEGVRVLGTGLPEAEYRLLVGFAPGR